MSDLEERLTEVECNLGVEMMTTDLLIARVADLEARVSTLMLALAIQNLHNKVMHDLDDMHTELKGAVYA